MTEQMAIDIGRQAIIIALKISSPMLIFGLVVGVSVGLLQAVTQVHELTLTFIPKMLVVAIALIIFLPWILRTLMSFMIQTMAMVSTL